MPTILLALSLPVGAIAYVVATRVVTSIWPNEGFLILIVPLFFAGLAMLPFLIPFFDRKAKEDLAAYRRTQESSRQESGGEPADGPPASST